MSEPFTPYEAEYLARALREWADGSRAQFSGVYAKTLAKLDAIRTSVVRTPPDSQALVRDAQGRPPRFDPEVDKALGEGVRLLGDLGVSITKPALLDAMTDPSVCIYDGPMPEVQRDATGKPLPPRTMRDPEDWGDDEMRSPQPIEVK